ncbi:carbohydrate kinase family protein [Xylophilus ampelinus]|uniref:Ribokinase n=1 Tax=Xylophilus ampelinus TaxID=54067 RepID=A0A318SGF1_9BURK|nr:carbohydrate kinase family protein [Xylophilus ampelinus]MCS4510450.1 carbohydrate kinase family protein [Xylophilus ampelinus]PYE77903.1 ribokinase [Xylophilus ampelinus]
MVPHLFSAAGSRPYDLTVLGDPCMDFFFTAPRLPLTGEKCLGRMPGSFSGGSETNMACAASRLGLRVALCGHVGDDRHADHLLEDLQLFGIDSAHVMRLPGTASASAMVFIAVDGEKSLIYSPLSPAPVLGERLAGLIGQSGVFFSAPYELTRFLAYSDIARGAGTDVAVDLEPAMVADQAAYHRLLRGADLVFCNADSFHRLNGISANVDNMRALLAFGPRLIVVTLGDQGALCVGREAVASHPGFRRPAVDTTGAGDCFAGAFLACALRGAGLDQALTYACAAASFTVSSIGARSAYPQPHEVSGLLLQSP